MAEAWLGLTLAFYTDWPSSFWISLLSSAAYLLALGWQVLRHGRILGAGVTR